LPKNTGPGESILIRMIIGNMHGKNQNNNTWKKQDQMLLEVN
jgi:hypothetical protein